MLVSRNTALSAKETIEHAIQLINNQVEQGDYMSLKDLSKAVHLSEYYLCRMFKNTTGISPGKMLTANRIDLTKRLLIDSTLSITSICFEVGYTSVPTFTSRFRRMVAVSPTQIRSLDLSADLRGIEQLIDKKALEGRGTGRITGTISCLRNFDGYAFIGLFNTPIPEGSPVRCTIVKGCSEFVLSDVPTGKYFVLAVGFEKDTPLKSVLIPSRALRGGIKQGLFCSPGTTQYVNIELREARDEDPPILLSLPSLVNQQINR